ncbi:hypothetical protein F2P81_011153 [Scophthalmus maximus]|uniref:Uncharacterized protein n=1 Tax=Scophthalmus maximus TaxID=52904 RepID=A0A6A4SXS6_SCOMX|nr:hypothetical protein F2P81_011153 [Scophthalmus maximus]
MSFRLCCASPPQKRLRIMLRPPAVARRPQENGPEQLVETNTANLSSPADPASAASPAPADAASPASPAPVAAISPVTPANPAPPPANPAVAAASPVNPATSPTTITTTTTTTAAAASTASPVNPTATTTTVSPTSPPPNAASPTEPANPSNPTSPTSNLTNAEANVEKHKALIPPPPPRRLPSCVRTTLVCFYGSYCETHRVEQNTFTSEKQQQRERRQFILGPNGSIANFCQGDEIPHGYAIASSPHDTMNEPLQLESETLVRSLRPYEPLLLTIDAIVQEARALTSAD